MEIIGKIIEILPAQTGKSARGEWKKQEFILEVPAQFPKKLCIANWNDKIDLNGADASKNVKVYFDIESREFNGRWYTDMKAWKMDILDQATSETAPPPSAENLPAGDFPWDNETTPEGGTDDLPF